MRLKTRPYSIFIISVICIILSYYIAIILHEWGHGSVAWWFGYKKAFYDVDYGGWLLLHVDENVPYKQILAAHQGLNAALIGIAGLTVSIILFLFSLLALSKIRKNVVLFSFFYWFAVINLVPIIQYLPVQPFSSEGDTGEFVHGLNISLLLVFIPGSIFVIVVLYYFLHKIIPKAYAILSIKTLLMKRVFLGVSLGLMFLLIYIGGYNPLSDKGMPFFGKVLAVISICFVPILYYICNPSRVWVSKQIQKNT